MISEVCNVFSPSGSEGRMREYIIDKISGKFDEIRADSFGNLIAKSGEGKLCIECSMDSCGIMIVSTDEKSAHFAGVGGINAEYLIGKKIIFADGSIGIVRYDGKTPNEAKISDLYLECDTDKLSVGDFGVVKSGYCETSDKMFANGLGNRVGISAVLEALCELKKTDNLCVLFSAQKRLGARGIQAFFAGEELDRVITVDAADAKKVKECSIVLADQSGVCSPDFREDLKKYTQSFAVTDENMCMANISAAGKGAACAALAVPLQNKNNNFEAVKKEDFSKCVDLLKAIITDLQNK